MTREYEMDEDLYLMAYLPLFFNVEAHQILHEHGMVKCHPFWLLSDSSVCFLRRHVSLKQSKLQKSTIHVTLKCRNKGCVK